MRGVSAAVLFGIVFTAVMCSWVEARWPTSVPEAAAFALAAGWAAAGVLGKAQVRLSTALIPLGLILAWGGAQIATGATAYEYKTNVALLYWACNGATFFVALQICSSRELREKLLQALVYFALALSILGPVQELYGGGKVMWLFEPFPRFIPQFGPFPYRNQYSAFIELLLPIPLFRALTEEKKRSFNVIAAAVMYASVIAAGSRMGVFLATGELPGTLLLAMWTGRLRVRLLGRNALLFALMFAMLVAAAGPSEMLKKFEAEDPYAGRREFAESGILMIRARPLTGFGLGNWDTAYPGYALFDNGLHVNQAHNDWVQWGGEGGLPMVAMMLWIAIWAVPRALRTGWGFGVAAVFVHCIVDYPIQRTSVALVMFIVMAAIAGRGAQETET